MDILSCFSGPRSSIVPQVIDKIHNRDGKMLFGIELFQLLSSNKNMGLITDWLGCTPEAAALEFGLGTLMFFVWYAIMWLLGRKE